MNSMVSLTDTLRNYLHSLILLVAMLSLLGLIGWLLLGPIGILWFLIAGIIIFIGAARIPPHFIFMKHDAKILRPEEAPHLYDIVVRLCRRAGIKNIPTIYLIPGKLMDVFTAGLNSNTSIIISYNMLRRLNTRELTAVLAHEISHIRGNDLLVMMIASVIANLTATMAMVGSILILIYIPLYILADEPVPWLLLIILMVAPFFSTLLQLALSRSREFSADLEAVRLTEDPLSLASALEKIETYQWNWLEKIFMQPKRDPIPPLLRTHPQVTDRVRRLKELAAKMR
ncbi:MAG: zinc metalloprotease HtpX [Gammaproteobacteria bacterium]|nr:zinc metalloprotease HtpX [Gammaproteobacteria bacterium]